MEIEDVVKKRESGELLVGSGGNLPSVDKIMRGFRGGIEESFRTGDFSNLVSSMSDVYELMLERVEAGRRAELEMGVMSEIVSKDMDALVKFNGFITKLALEIKKSKDRSDDMKFRQAVEVEKLKRGSGNIGKAENVQILNIMGTMSKEEKKKLKELIGGNTNKLKG